MRVYPGLLLLPFLVAAGPVAADAIADNNTCYEQFVTGNNQGVIEYCSKAIDSGDLEPADLVAALINRGVANRATGNAEAAVTDYTRALIYSPDDAMIHANRANALRDLGKLDDAFADAEKAIKLNPHRAASFYTRGAIHEAQGRSAEAKKDYFQALALDPENKDYKQKVTAP